MEEAIRQAIDAWLADPAIAAADQDEIRQLGSAGREEELADRFYRRLEFGTGGLRGVLGAGLNRMNIYTVGAAAQGLAAYVVRQGDAARQAGVVIACDSRRLSDVFTRRTAEVMAGNGIRAWLFESLRPTPELSFAVRHLSAAAGVMVTASHNPPEYNGLKVFWSDGGQVVPPHDTGVMDEVQRVVRFADVRRLPLAEAQTAGLVRLVGGDIDDAYLEAVQQSCLEPELSRRWGPEIKIVYTPLHGSGMTLVPQALQRRGFERVSVVARQAEPDGEFPTVAAPNPEDPAALALAVEQARREAAELVIGTDPDADRLGVAVRDDGGGFVALTGNRVAALLTWFICEQLTRQRRFPERAVVISTIVSGDMMKDIARSYGAEVIETLTGFKWIAQWVTRFEAEAKAGHPARCCVFAAEESYGYMPAMFTRDKDAVNSSAFVADLAAWCRSQGKSIHGLLQELFRRFGYYDEGARSLTLQGRSGAEKIRLAMQTLRRDPPAQLGGVDVRTTADLETGEIRERRAGRVVGRYEVPASDVVLLALADGTRAIVRPSGTEPKIKFYVLTREPGADLDVAQASTGRKIQAVLEDLLACSGLTSDQ